VNRLLIVSVRKCIVNPDTGPEAGIALLEITTPERIWPKESVAAKRSRIRDLIILSF